MEQAARSQRGGAGGTGRDYQRTYMLICIAFGRGQQCGEGQGGRGRQEQGGGGQWEENW